MLRCILFGIMYVWWVDDSLVGWLVHVGDDFWYCGKNLLHRAALERFKLIF